MAWIAFRIIGPLWWKYIHPPPMVSSHKGPAMLRHCNTLHWRHNDNGGVSNRQPHGCLLNRYSDADQRKHQSSASLAFVWGIHRDRWIPRTKGQQRGKWLHLMASSWLQNYEKQGRWDDEKKHTAVSRNVPTKGRLPKVGRKDKTGKTNRLPQILVIGAKKCGTGESLGNRIWCSLEISASYLRIRYKVRPPSSFVDVGYICQYLMMTLSNGNIFRVNGLCMGNPPDSPHEGQ